jgi:16S rRNA U516 pseudouridylate synthase RsuA-like enzyme
MKSINRDDFIVANASNNNHESSAFISIDNYDVSDPSRKNIQNHYHNHDDDNNVVGVHDDSDNNNVSINQTISCIKLSVTEGKYRMVRRILHNCGYSVLYLHRLSYGSIILDENVIVEGKLGHVNIDQQQKLIDEYQLNNKKNKKKK